MEPRIFGTTDMMITRIGFGAWAIGGGNRAFGWGPQDDGEAIAWTLRNPAVTAAIVGGRNARQVDGSIHGSDFELTAEDPAEIGI